MSSASAARVCAGAGIVSGSDPIQEFDETEAKLQGTLDAILRAEQSRP
jgi:isochorismate synthase EntC